MHLKTMRALTLIPFLACFLVPHTHAKSEIEQAAVKEIVDSTIEPLKQKFDIPGMAVGVTVRGKSYFYHYGVMSKATQKPVTDQTLFEIGSVSKTFAATLASLAQVEGKLSLSDSVSKHVPALSGGSFDHVTLLELGTYTSGLPLFVPEGMQNTSELMHHLKAWKPPHPVGSRRVYSNIASGMLGMIAAQSLRVSYAEAIEKTLFRPLGMTSSYINVPPDHMDSYAQGYTAKDVPVRMNMGVLGEEAYGVKSSAADLIRFVEANMQLATLPLKLQRAIDDTHTGYFKTGEFVQGLIWEQYPYPIALDTLLAGNSSTRIYQPTDAARLSPPLRPQPDVLINKTGSTNGFSAYVAFVPAQKLGVVILANKSYPIDQRVTAGYRMLKALSN